ncbi:ribonuclease Y [Colidextribacter sp. 210702-DFI.3.9]|uniref:Ribonuclease Y n=1 Tax=Flintibacter faecis TaxID=2763047 RepID=A0A8J6J567_9FIRM|nr:ribonuclease Y [Flintibacter faecis]MBC5717801.1 ribonuclease Y [Flintibacter faecis]MCB6500207.1 ribonuclease Y [Colidextribacter sp. 210702-DFI.3.9]MCG4469074.1 ribonuclease Y [Lawsonibacter sp. DFI.6.74]MCG4774567.1 ribonuclease Y [Lawsonibacter sp. DFI.5.51]
MFPYLIGAIIGIVIGLAVGVPVGIQQRKKSAEREIGSAEDEAKRIINEAYKSAESKKREAMVEAKEEILKARNEHEREVKERRADLQRQEHRLQQKEETLDRKTDNIEKKEEQLTARLAKLESTQAEAEQAKQNQLEMLERISGFTADEAKNYLLQQLEQDVTHESAMKIKEIEARFKDEADTKAREIISLAIQRYAADHVAEATVSVVPLPNDEMKGRIIGREGRNIRTLETLTGVDLIIDDTPEAITVSCFDPVRREIARLALEKLILDGRIHPARIEEMVEKAKREVDAVIKSEGERAIFETNVHGLHPELVKLLGRMRYRTSYGQNVLNHSIEVSHIAGLLAAEIGANVAEAKRAGLLHDLGKSVDHEVEGSHVQIGVELARKYHESENIIHAIQAHHNDVEPRTIVACLVQAADAISAARPGARRENVENYIKRLEMLEEITSSFPGVEKSFAIQAGREVRIMVKPEVISEDQMVLLARDIAKKIEDELEYPGQIKVHLLRETKAIEYAK